MSAKSESYLDNLIWIALGAGSLLAAAVLHQNASNPIAQKLVGFGGWIGEMAGFSGYWPSLLIGAVVCGLLLMLTLLMIGPKVEEWAAQKAAERGRKTLNRTTGRTVEEEMKLLVKKYGQ